MITVTLTDVGERAAAEVAEWRVREAKRLNARDRFGIDSVDSHYWGCAGEIAIARYLGLPWRAASGEWAVADVGRYEVRAVAPGARWAAKAKDNDPPERAVAIVVMRTRRQAGIAGWTTVEEIRRLGRWEDPGKRNAPAWFLTDLSRLRADFPEIVR